MARKWIYQDVNHLWRCMRCYRPINKHINETKCDCRPQDIERDMTDEAEASKWWR